MNVDTAPFGTRGTLCLQGTLHAALFWKVDHSSWSKGHFKRSRAADDLPLPVQMEFLFGKLFPLVGPARLYNRPPAQGNAYEPNGYLNRHGQYGVLARSLPGDPSP